jgi:diguanylate cyclase (GGDEF)-like protein
MRRAWWIYPILVAALIGLYRIVGGSHVPVVAAVGLISVAAIGVGLAAFRPARWRAWVLLAMGVAVVAAGEISYDVIATGVGTDEFPSLVDVLYLAAYPPLAIGLLWLGVARTPSRDVTAMIDTAALSLGGSLVVWVVLVRPTVDSLHLTGAAKVIAVAGWVGDAVVVAAAARLVTLWPRNMAAALLGAAIVALAAGDVLYGVDLIRGTWSSGGPPDLCLMAFLGLAGAAAITPSMTRLGSAQTPRQRLGNGRLWALAAALLVAPTALLAEATRGPVGTPIAIGIVSVAITMLALWRLADAVRGQRRAVVRDAEIRQAARRVGLATSADVVVASVASAFAAMTHGSAGTVRLETAPTNAAAQADDEDALRLPVDAGSGPDKGDGAPEPVRRDLVFTASAADLAELEDVLGGLTEQAAVALQRIDLTDRIRTNHTEQAILAYRASHDALTGLANVQLFRDRLAELAETASGDTTTAVVFIDLDDFKAINDTLGHEVGDGVLIAAARRIQGSLRAGDLAARLGGDEFAVLLPDADDAIAHAIAERITDNLARPTTVAGLPVHCRASAGVATASRPIDYPLLMRRADDALYAAKAHGKGRWRPYQPTMHSPLHRGSDLRAELQRLLQPADIDAPSANGLAMHYQPIVELAQGATRGYEALIRWQHPDRGMIPATELISVAEQTGLIVPLGNWALRRIIIDASQLTAAPDGGRRYVSANIAPRQLHQTGFVTEISNAVAAARLDPTRLVVEITETQLLDDDDIWKDLAKLRQRGIRIAIDDFGTGYASLSYLRHPVIDIVKLDRVFLRDTTDRHNRRLLSAVVGLTRDLGIELIAEGIEDDTTRTTLIDLGVQVGQGHLFATAMPIDHATQWTRQRALID